MSLVRDAIDVFKIAEVSGALDSIKALVARKHRILLLGASGVGKTNFKDSLTAGDVVPIDYRDRTQFVNNYKLFVDNTLLVIKDTPGEELHEARRLDAYQQAAADGVIGIINVVCYGYHELHQLGAVPREAIVDGKANPTFLEYRRRIEIDAVREWATRFSLMGPRGWVFTLVSKADLWWTERDAVITYYASGDYAAAISCLDGWKHVIIPYAAVLHKFYGIAPMAGTFDQTDQRRCKGEFIRILMEAIGRPGSHGKR